LFCDFEIAHSNFNNHSCGPCVEPFTTIPYAVTYVLALRRARERARSYAMNNVLDDLDRTYEGTVTYDVSDDELEAAAEGNCAWLMPTESADAPCC
jgi:hypothetical protein